MASITLPERDVVSRLNQLYTVFAPLRDGLPRVAVGFAKDSPGGTKALVASDAPSNTLQRRQTMFSTTVASIRCQYFELWKVSKGQLMTLNRAYFTLLRLDPVRRDFSDVLSLHTDPDDDDEMKQGPHLHISCAPEPLPHCHFPLEAGFLELVLKDSEALTAAMQRAIGLVAKDVLPRFKDH
jgi:hypothetical protein